MPCGSLTPGACSPRTRRLPKPPFFYTTKWLRPRSIRANSFSSAKSCRRGRLHPLCRSDVLWERIEKELPGLAQNCLTKGLKYSNAMPAEADLISGMGRSWQSTLSVNSRQEAEARLSELEYSWEWMELDELRVTSPTLPAVRELDNGKRSFFNQLIAAFKGWKDSRNDPSKSITYGDGSCLDPSEIERVWRTCGRDNL